jgi:hypothetical protein
VTGPGRHAHGTGRVPPVLLLVFNRPAPTLQVLSALRQAQPSRLYVAADGPRPDRPGDVDDCAEVRRIIRGVDWRCRVTTLYRKENLGCHPAVRGALDWFFQHEDEGIILEDDCLPSLSFFQYATELLARFRDDPRVMHVTGNCFQVPQPYGPASYHFSQVALVWGWATWRRAWQRFDASSRGWPALRDGKGFKKLFPQAAERRYWASHFDRLHARLLDNWDSQWLLSILLQGGFCATPAVNLVKNIGIGSAEATHTRGAIPFLQQFSAGELHFPLVHPTVVEVDHQADHSLYMNCFRHWEAGRHGWRARIRRVLGRSQ